MPRGLCNAISVACQLRKKAAAAEIGRLGVWTNHVKISVVASENALQPDELIASYPHTFGLGNGLSVVCAVASGLGGKVTVYIKRQASDWLLESPQMPDPTVNARRNAAWITQSAKNATRGPAGWRKRAARL